MKKILNQVTCVDIKGNEYIVDTNELSFRPAVYAFIVKNNKVLLSKQWDGYDFPGGGIELGENTEDALIREVKEETGLEVSVKELFFTSNSFFKLPFKDKFVHSIHLFYKCVVVGGELSTEFFDDNEKKYAELAEWIDLDDAKNLKIYSSINSSIVIRKYKENE